MPNGTSSSLVETAPAADPEIVYQAAGPAEDDDYPPHDEESFHENYPARTGGKYGSPEQF